MELNQDLEEARQLFKELQQKVTIQKVIAQKLELLQIGLDEEPGSIDLTNYDQIQEQDCQQLLKLSRKVKVSMFLNIVRDLAQQHNITPSQTQLIQGDIDVRTKTLKRWKQKSFELRIAQKTFEILRSKKKSPNKKKQRIVALQFYQLRVQPLKHERWRFSLKSLKSGQGYYKELVCGTSDVKSYNIIIEVLKKLCFFNKDAIMPGLDSQIVRKDKQSLTVGPMLAQSVIIKPEENPIKQQTLEFEPPQQRQYQSMAMGKPSKQKEFHEYEQADCKQGLKFPVSPNVENQKIMTKQDQDFQKNAPKTVPHKELNEGRNFSFDAQVINNQGKQNRNSNLQPKAEEFETVKNQIVLPNEVKQVEYYKPTDPEARQQFQSIQLLQPIQQQAEEEDEFHDAEEFEEVVEQHEREQFPQLFQKIIDEGKLQENYLKIGNENYLQVHLSDSVQILRSKTNHLQFRCFTIIENSDIECVFQALAEIEFMKKWNGNINSEGSKFVSLIQSERSAIISEKRTQYGLFYLPRDYCYLRNVFEKNGSFYIIDRSIEHEDCPQNFRVIRGEINYQIIQIENIQNQQGKIQVSLETEITNGGFSSTEQDGQITFVYLQELKNIHQFLTTYQKQSFKTPLLNALQQSIMQKKQRAKFYQISAKQSSLDSGILQENFDNGISPIKQEQPQEQNNFQREPSFDDQMFMIKDMQRRLSTIQDTGTFQPSKIMEVGAENENEIQEFQKQQQDDEFEPLPNQQEYFLQTDLITSTSQEISQAQREQILKQVKIVEQGNYFGNCIHHKFILEPFETKTELITEYEGTHFFYKKDWQRDQKSGGLQFINVKKVEAQKKVIKFMLKKMGSNLLSGKSILSISLPVEIFETRSNLERFGYAFCYAPKYLEEGAKLSTPEEQMKSTVTFGLSTIIMYLSLEKPFNPIIGETYQGYIGGCPVFCEQISHHPPICAMQLYGRGYRLDGHIETVANMHANSIEGKNVGYLRITYYNTKAQQYYISVPGTLHGTAFGDRIFNLSGKGLCIDPDNQIIWEATFNPGKASLFSKKETPQDYFSGGIYKVKQQAIDKFKRDGYAKYSGIDFNKDVITKLNTTTGIWNQYLEIDNVYTWNLQMCPHQLSNHPNPLPSDSAYRLDILHWKLRDFDNSQRTKEIMEIEQRNDRKLKEKFRGKQH